MQPYRKCLSQSEARVAIFVDGSIRKNTNFVEDLEYLLPVDFRQNSFYSFWEEVGNMKINDDVWTDGRQHIWC